MGGIDLIGLWADLPISAVALFWASACIILLYFMSRPRRIFMVGYSCYQPADDRKCSLEVSEYFTRRTERFSDEAVHFMSRVFRKAGLGDETYGPPFPYNEENPVESLENALEETTEVMYGAVDALLEESGVSIPEIDILITSSSMFCPVPSLSSIMVNRYKFKENVKSANISGMGCSSGVMALQTAADLLKTHPKSTYALVVTTENITMNTYYGKQRAMLVTNCIFRVGCSAVLLSSRSQDRARAKLELVHALRSHHGADDRAYTAAFQKEDEDGYLGVELTKDLIRVAGECLVSHVRTLAPRVLPYSELVKYVWSYIALNFFKMEGKPYVPDFSKAFEHFCIHSGGKAVINEVGKSLKLDDYSLEPARMVLNRFGNTSSSLVFYELAYFEAKERIKEGDRVWMIAFGTGFKINSIVWKAVHDWTVSETCNPWVDCIHRYPVKF